MKQKHRRILSLIIAAVMIAGIAAACAPQQGAPGSAASGSSELGLDNDLRFTTTRKITVAVYDRSNDGGSPPDNNYYTDYIKQGVLDKHNIAVEYVRIPRWTEGQ